jgi:hypothetical protein
MPVYAPKMSAIMMTAAVGKFFRHFPSIIYTAVVTPALKCAPPTLPVSIAAINMDKAIIVLTPPEKLMPNRKMAVPVNSKIASQSKSFFSLT